MPETSIDVERLAARPNDKIHGDGSAYLETAMRAAKWGNGLAVPLPKPVVESLGLSIPETSDGVVTIRNRFRR